MKLHSQAKTKPQPSFTPVKTGLLQRKCACGSSSGLTGKCTGCQEEQLNVQRRAANQGELGEVPPIVHEVLSSQGQPLDAHTRTFMESRFGHDFSSVRVHTDGKAGQSAQPVNALAYTVGRDVVFGAGHYNPGSTTGQRLLAHELTHTIQQSNSIQQSIAKLDSGHLADAPEQEAENAANIIFTNQAVNVTSHQSANIVQRENGGSKEDDNWVKDKNGTLYYKTEDEAKRRMKALQQEENGSEYRVKSFVLNKETYWRVEIRGSKQAEEAPTDSSKQKEDASKPADEATKDKADKKVCLTFDDGPQSGTEDVLNGLKDESAPAAFFLTGKNMASNQALQKQLVERMINEGHQLGNHTFTHNPATSKEYEKAYGDLSDPANLKKFQANYAQNEQHFQTLLSKTQSIFKIARLPGNGRFVKAGGKLIYVIGTEGMGMAHVTWHFEFATNGSFGHLTALDWQGIKGVAAEVTSLPKPNNIILLHDRHWAGKKSLFKAILQKLKAEGFILAKLDASGKCT
ncbi:eCIS core domain-containing protein [Nostoc sp. CCY 9925]|uniref:eCIS core domain-containing protein n=1 Tax=Nostoc sp. CCY 9925 TaxID=3103865 RepID=UPI0039C5D1DC